jgi:hypothetical protein
MRLYRRIAASRFLFPLVALGLAGCARIPDLLQPARTVTGVTLSTSSLELPAGQSYFLVAVVSPSDAGDKRVVWNTSDDGVASVDQSGRVTAIAEGAAAIIATTMDGGYSSKCSVTARAASSAPDPTPSPSPDPTAGPSTYSYSTDFLGDPGWSTNNPSRYHWDPVTGSLFTDNYTNSGDWITKTIPYSGESFELQFDIRTGERDTGDVCFGLFDSAKLSNSPTGEKLYVLFGGYQEQIYLSFLGASGTWNSTSPGSGLMLPFEWHHVRVAYDEASHALDFSVSRDGNPVVAWQGNVEGGYSANLDYLGISMAGGWVTSDRHEVAYIDNVTLSLY